VLAAKMRREDEQYPTNQNAPSPRNGGPKCREKACQEDRHNDADLEINIPKKNLKRKNDQDLAAHGHPSG
jgi:hypothetical protein